MQSVEQILKTHGIYGLGEAFIAGDWTPENLSESLYQIAISKDLPLRKFHPQLAVYLLKEFFLNNQAGHKAYEIARRHYDLADDLFAHMLDSSRSYTCAIWDSPFLAGTSEHTTAASLEDAQINKLRVICEKLKLQSGMRVIDIGCGWGNFAKYAASNYGVSVVGLTVSKNQADYARSICKDLPVEILVQEYQTFSGQFDRAVSIEMIEAVGRKNLPFYFKKVASFLKPRGLFVLQGISAETITWNSHPLADQYVLWLLKHIFPNGYLPRLSELVAPAKTDFILEQIENLDGQYEKTLAAWEQNFLNAWPILNANFDETFKRIWLFYLCGCQAFFRAKMVQVYQCVYTKR